MSGVTFGYSITPQDIWPFSPKQLAPAGRVNVGVLNCYTQNPVTSNLVFNMSCKYEGSVCGLTYDGVFSSHISISNVLLKDVDHSCVLSYHKDRNGHFCVSVTPTTRYANMVIPGV